MKRISLIAIALMMGMMMLVSCNKDKDNNDGKVVFHASIGMRSQGRTYLDPVDTIGYIKWSTGDQIRIYNSNGEDAVFTLQSGANTTNGTFAFAGEFDMVSPFIAVYPHTATMDDDGKIVFEVPAVQDITQPGTFANGANPMLAKSTDDNLIFENLCGGLGVRLYGDAHVSSITVMGIESEKLNGQFEVVYGEDEELETYPYGDGGNNVVTLTCDVTLTSEVTDFYAVLPVGVLSHGVLVEIYDGETMVGQIPYPEGHAAQVARDTIKSFPPVEVTTGGGGDDHEYVDLGLPSGLLWATCNVGADTPEGYGDYFAWGETTPKDTYTFENYQYWIFEYYDEWGAVVSITKYCNDASYGYNGFTDNLTTLLPEDDAAAANWGNGWRMPTKEEFEELYNNTTVTWTQQNGVNGRLFTASNGNSLFLPAAGRHWDDGLILAGSWGDNWSSSLYTGEPSGAWSFDFGSDYYNVGSYGDGRYGGFPVRPVRCKNSVITVSADPTAGGTVSGGGTYMDHTTCTLTATANSGYTFENWTNEDGTVVSTEAAYTFTVSGNRRLVANFTQTHAYVDLGLPSGLLWATCNVGADTPEGYGDYFAWGETAPKDTYDWSTYQYGDGNTFTKYTGSDNLTTLLPEDDAATATWGNGWRMPTKEEWQELLDNTTSTWTGSGRLFTASNGNSLFLPAAGYCIYSSLYLAGSYGYSWSSSLYTGFPSYAWYYSFSSDNCDVYSSNRFFGRSVRAVRSGL